MVTYFGTAFVNGCGACNEPHCFCVGTPTPTPYFDDNGRQVYLVGPSGFLLIVEAKPGPNGAAVGRSVPVPIAGQPNRPDLQILPNRNLGNGSAAVCDSQPVGAGGGGIPGFNPIDFGPSQAVTDALVDFACRFSVQSADSPCTLNSFGNPSVLTPGGLPSTGRQFCYLAEQNSAVPSGDTVVAVQLRDTQGNLGPRREIVLRRP